MLTFEETLRAAKPFIDFLNRDSFFDRPYDGNTDKVRVVSDAKIAYKHATEQTDEFSYWGDLMDGEFPDSFEWWDMPKTFNSSIERHLNKNSYYGVLDRVKKIDCDSDLLWEIDGTMPHHIDYILHCYQNEYFPPVWAMILDAYLHNGFPCGWDGIYPNGKLVVFNNK